MSTHRFNNVRIHVEPGSTPETWLVSVAFDSDVDCTNPEVVDRQPTMTKAIESAYTVRRAFELAGHDVTLKSPKGYHRPA